MADAPWAQLGLLVMESIEEWEVLYCLDPVTSVTSDS
jgi:hypothetical protein